MTTPVCQITSTGIERPPLATILAWATAQFQAIYGADIYLGSDSMDGELVGLFASAIDDCNAMAVSAYQSFSPATAQGTGLSSVVKINGIARKIPSYSTAPVLVVGQANTPITAGIVADANGYDWALPASVVIPSAGQILVTATCQTPGAISAPIGSISVIQNTQPGWQSATNTVVATPGAPVETDAQLRIRQSQSTMNASTGMLDGMVGSLLTIPGVTRAAVYGNDFILPDSNGIPGHCIAAVVEGGDLPTVAAMIKSKKGGCGTYGTTSQVVISANGVPSTVNFFLLATPQISVTVNIRALNGFISDTSLLIQTSVANFGNKLGIGANVQLSRFYASAYLFGAAQSQTYEVVSILMSRDGLPVTNVDVAIAFNEAASFVSANVIVVVNP